MIEWDVGDNARSQLEYVFHPATDTYNDGGLRVSMLRARPAGPTRSLF
jgi:hypothetical protein